VEAQEFSKKRRYRRVKVPVSFRFAGSEAPSEPIVDLSLGGIRVVSDDDVKVGEPWKIELQLPDNTAISCTVRVVWARPMPGEDNKKRDVGLEFTELPEGGLQRLSSVLD